MCVNYKKEATEVKLGVDLAAGGVVRGAFLMRSACFVCVSRAKGKKGRLGAGSGKNTTFLLISSARLKGTTTLPSVYNVIVRFWIVLQMNVKRNFSCK